MQILKRTLAVAATLLVAAGAPAVVAAQSPNFSGRWELSPAKSNFGDMAAGAPTKSTMVIVQSPGAVKVDQSMTTPQGDMKSATEYTLDGKQSTSSAPDGSPMTHTARMDGETLEIATKIAMQGADIVRLGRWTLSPDRNTLTIDLNLTTPMGATKMKLVYDKKTL